MKIEAVVFDFGRTLGNPDTKQLFPGVVDVLQQLRDREIRLALVTIARYASSREDELAAFGLTRFFSTVEILDFRSGRPRKDFGALLVGMGVEPQGSAVVGDNLEEEIRAGNEIGAYTIWTTQNLSRKGLQLPEEGSIYRPRDTIRAITELVPKIDPLNSYTP